MNNKKSYKGLGIFALIITIVMISSYVGAGLIIKDANGDIRNIFSNLDGFSLNLNNEHISPEFTYTDSSSNSLVTSIKQPLENVNCVNINTFSPDIEVKAGNADEISIELITKSNNVKLDKIVSNNQLTVYVKAKKMLGSFNLTDCKVEVTIPADYKKQLVINGKSANISINDISFRNLNIHSLSGDVFLENSSTEEAIISTVSGEIKSSQNSSKTIVLSSVSGDIDASGKYNSISSKSISGEITLDLSKDLTSAKTSSTSGDIIIKTEGNFSSNLDLSTTSGEIENNMNVKNSTSSDRKVTADSVDASDKTIIARTISGDIKIN